MALVHCQCIYNVLQWLLCSLMLYEGNAVVLLATSSIGQ